jgi:hypothetical protein
MLLKDATADIEEIGGPTTTKALESTSACGFLPGLLGTWWNAEQQRTDFDYVKFRRDGVCVFNGYPRTGDTLVVQYPFLVARTVVVAGERRAQIRLGQTQRAYLYLQDRGEWIYLSEPWPLDVAFMLSPGGRLEGYWLRRRFDPTLPVYAYLRSTYPLYELDGAGNLSSVQPASWGKLKDIDTPDTELSPSSILKASP